MEKLKLYIVTKSSIDKIFKSGDLIGLSSNGDLNNAMAGGGCHRTNVMLMEQMILSMKLVILIIWMLLTGENV